MLNHYKKLHPAVGPLVDKHLPYLKRIELPAKTVLLDEGSISGYYYFVIKGCIRTKFNNNGKDKTVQFFFENEGLISLESFLNNVPSPVAIETIEPSVLTLLPKENFSALLDDMDRNTGFTKMFFRIMGERQIHYMNELISFLKDSPERRYRNLQEQNPDLIKRIPQHYIASYLGISTVHLSRIKAKVSKGAAHF